MSAPVVHPPSARLVGEAWVQLALPDVEVGATIPKASDLAVQNTGFVRVSVVGGYPGTYLPTRDSVIGAECWLAPRTANGADASWGRAEDLGERLLNATHDRRLWPITVDLSSVGSYAPAKVHTVRALGEPQRVEDDPSGWARVDVDLLITWTGA